MSVIHVAIQDDSKVLSLETRRVIQETTNSSLLSKIMFRSWVLVVFARGKVVAWPALISPRPYLGKFKVQTSGNLQTFTQTLDMSRHVFFVKKWAIFGIAQMRKSRHENLKKTQEI